MKHTASCLLNFFSYCHILGFPGNATMKQTCPHNNETDASIQQCKQAVIEFHSNKTSHEVVSGVREQVGFGRKHTSLYRGR
jgi:hypothetical protein